MAFSIRLTNGTLLTTVDDGTINDTACSLTLIGKNYVGYGTLYNDNIVHLLENAANDTAPTTPLTGQLWWDTAGNLKVCYDGTNFKTISTVTSSATQPTSAVTGNSWWDTTNQQLFVYNGSSWILVGPAFTANTGTSGFVVSTILDDSSNSHIVLDLYVGSTLLGIYSKDNEFTPLSPISGFVTIKPGFNFVSESVVSDIKLWGTAYNADYLGGYLANTYVRAGGTINGNITINGNATIGNISTVSITATGNITTTANLTAGNISGIIRPTAGSGEAGIIFPANPGGGSGDFANIKYYASAGETTVLELSVTNDSDDKIKLNASGGTEVTNTLYTTAISSGSSATAGTITGNWTLTSGSKLNATYADLAEKFTADANYKAGTLVRIGGAKEITQENHISSEEVLGVISSEPAYVMNAGIDGLPVALSGKVPVRVIGRVKKGDRLVSAGNGAAKSASRDEITAFNVIGRALENKYDDDEGLIMAIVKHNS